MSFCFSLSSFSRRRSFSSHSSKSLHTHTAGQPPSCAVCAVCGTGSVLFLECGQFDKNVDPVWSLRWIVVPALVHQLHDLAGAVVGRRHAIALRHLLYHLRIGEARIGRLTVGKDLPEHHAKGPHVFMTRHAHDTHTTRTRTRHESGEYSNGACGCVEVQVKLPDWDEYLSHLSASGAVHLTGMCPRDESPVL